MCSSGVVGFTRVRTAGLSVLPGSLGSLAFALGVIGFIWSRKVHSGSLWGRQVHPGLLGSLGFTLGVAIGVVGFHPGRGIM